MKPKDTLASVLEVFVSALDAAKGEAQGRTVIQNWCYLTSVVLGTPLDFISHHYGPYSPTLAGMMTSFATSDFLQEKTRITGAGRIVYCYELTPDGKALAREIQNRSPDFYRAARKVVETCTEVAKNNINILSCAAKVYYILSQKGKSVTYSEVRRLAKKFGWRLSTEEIDSAMELLQALELAQKET